MNIDDFIYKLIKHYKEKPDQEHVKNLREWLDDKTDGIDLGEVFNQAIEQFKWFPKIPEIKSLLDRRADRRHASRRAAYVERAPKLTKEWLARLRGAGLKSAYMIQLGKHLAQYLKTGKLTQAMKDHTVFHRDFYLAHQEWENSGQK